MISDNQIKNTSIQNLTKKEQALAEPFMRQTEHYLYLPRYKRFLYKLRARLNKTIEEK